MYGHRQCVERLSLSNTFELSARTLLARRNLCSVRRRVDVLGPISHGCDRLDLAACQRFSCIDTERDYANQSS